MVGMSIPFIRHVLRALIVLMLLLLGGAYAASGSFAAVRVPCAIVMVAFFLVSVVWYRCPGCRKWFDREHENVCTRCGHRTDGAAPAGDQAT